MLRTLTSSLLDRPVSWQKLLATYADYSWETPPREGVEMGNRIYRFGVARDAAGLGGITRETAACPGTARVLTAFVRESLPGFVFTTIDIRRIAPADF